MIAAGLPFSAAVLEVRLGAELDPRDVLRRTVDPSAFARTTTSPNSSGVDEPALRADGVGELLARRRGLAADLARGIDGVLRWIGVAQVGHREPQCLQLIGLQPDAHRVVRRRRRW